MQVQFFRRLAVWSLMIGGIVVGIENSYAAKKSQEPPKQEQVAVRRGPFQLRFICSRIDTTISGKEYVGCHDFRIGYPDDWQFVSMQSYGMETHCYELHFHRGEESLIVRLDLRILWNDATNEYVKNHFREDPGVMSLVKVSKMK